MEQKENQNQKHSETITTPDTSICDDWYTQALEDMEEFIESQGIYIRQ